VDEGSWEKFLFETAMVAVQQVMVERGFVRGKLRGGDR
jgi:hypothetical protein